MCNQFLIISNQMQNGLLQLYKFLKSIYFNLILTEQIYNNLSQFFIKNLLIRYNINKN